MLANKPDGITFGHCGASIETSLRFRTKARIQESNIRPAVIARKNAKASFR